MNGIWGKKNKKQELIFGNNQKGRGEVSFGKPTSSQKRGKLISQGGEIEVKLVVFLRKSSLRETAPHSRVRQYLAMN
ncbi:MAG: hypothetical protein DWQ02_28180 [Bacteroidetes bacterium]|nr:MAG: hypothetical protein DWQ02_28180 [Bacteroidota bacterium]